MSIKATFPAVLSQVPPLPGPTDLGKLRASMHKQVDCILVLDDDPTGTQTVHDVPVIANWSPTVLEEMLLEGQPLIFILTNSRSLSEKEAVALTKEIGSAIAMVSQKLQKRIWVISRSDSTLRGHFPAEIDALRTSMALEKSICFLIPAFFEGERVTVQDTHFLRNDNKWTPVAETEFAQDKVFGFQSSDLKEWIIEKGKGKITMDDVISLSVTQLRQLSTATLSAVLNDMPEGKICIVNALDYEDLYRFCMALAQIRHTPVFRTAASFVAALASMSSRELLTAEELQPNSQSGGLIVVGSYVPKTTQQLAYLMQKCPVLHYLELEIGVLLSNPHPDHYLDSMSDQIDHWIQAGEDVVLATSRKQISSAESIGNLEIGQQVSAAICKIVQQLSSRPRYLIAKGGITSSDVATQGLAVNSALVLGQIIKGVPVWRLDERCKYPNMTYVVFPGNVGSNQALYEVVRTLTDRNAQEQLEK